MHQGCRIERLPGRFARELLGCQFAQLLVDQRQELRGSLRIALVDCGEDAGDFSQGGTTRLAGGSVLLTLQVAIGRGKCFGGKRCAPCNLSHLARLVASARHGRAAPAEWPMGLQFGSRSRKNALDSPHSCGYQTDPLPGFATSVTCVPRLCLSVTLCAAIDCKPQSVLVPAQGGRGVSALHSNLHSNYVARPRTPIGFAPTRIEGSLGECRLRVLRLREALSVLRWLNRSQGPPTLALAQSHSGGG